MPTLPHAHPGTPDLRSPARFLWWLARGQAGTLLLGIACGVTWMVSVALFPAAVQRAIDEGIVGHDGGRLLLWGAALLALAGLAAAAGALRHRFAVLNWLQAAFRCVQLVGHKAADTGEALPRAIPTGEVVATVASDAMRIGGLYDVTARMSGALVSYVVVSLLMLGYSRPLGLVVAVGVPVLVAALAFILRPLQRRQAEQREQAGRLTTLGADTVAGLRVLRGIGGEETFLGRYRQQSQRVRRVGVDVAGVQAALDAAQVLLPGVFVVMVTWLGARFALAHTITAGQLVAFYGYSAFLVIPLRTATEFADRATRAHVGARKVIAVLAVAPDAVDAPVQATAPGMPPAGATLVDPVSGVSVTAGELTAVVSGRPEESVALADRLGRFGRTPTAARLGDTPLADLPLAAVRRRIVVSETDPRLFTGTLREELDPGGEHTDTEILRALAVASGEDVLDALPAGLDSEVEERGRSLSGGQRQRLALTRALLTGADTLVLVEPTSAVDAHTEARIGGRLAAARSGATTVVMTASPLLLDHADSVVFLEDGVASARGTHRELLAGCPAYRDVVVRGEEA